MKKIHCRMCKSAELKKFLDLGFTPLADGFLAKGQLDEPEVYYPLNVCVCGDCGLFQLDYIVPPDELYRKNYPYLSSTTKTGRDHFHNMAGSICRRFNLKKGSFVIDIGSNIGVLLEGFKKNGMDVLGIDPATNIAEMAKKKGIETWPDYFGSHLVNKILAKKGKPAVITGTNVFAHIDDIDDMVKAAKKLIPEGGIFILEFPYVVALIDNLEYDTIYHEHLSYMSVKPLVKYFRKFDMDVFNVEKFKIHGGTIRVFACNRGKRAISENVGRFLKLEEKKGIYSMQRLKRFADDVRKQKEELVGLLLDLKKRGKRIVGIGAPAKGNTLLNYCGIGKSYLEYLTEKSPTKVGLYSPGTHIPIVADSKVFQDKPDYALLLAWNFADEIMENMQKFRSLGKKFIIPIPKPKILE